MITLVIPIFNEEAVLPELFERLRTILADEPFEALFVNDGSTDQSVTVLQTLRSQYPQIKILNLSRNFGHQRAITAGLDHAKGDACIVMDADLQDPPDLLPRMIAQWRQGAQVVNACRSARDTDSAWKRWTAGLFYRFLHAIADVDIVPESGDFCLIDRCVIETFRQMRESHRFLRGMRRWTGFRQVALYYERPRRWSGTAKYSLWRMLALALDATTSFSNAPLRIAGGLGLLLSGVSGIYLAYVLYVRLIRLEAVPGWTSIMVVLLFLGSVQLLTLGVLGEYIGRIYQEVKRRPLYVVNSFIE